jgi:soluble lytic murein transglycosylase-like protein
MTASAKLKGLVAALPLLLPLPAGADEIGLALALQQTVASARSFSDPAHARQWLTRMSPRLRHTLPNPFYRMSLLSTVHEEAAYCGLSPELLLAVIEVESSFNRNAVSPTGARGLMQVMPFWMKEIGHPRDDLFNPRTNIRYGCRILKGYVDDERGDLETALARYNGSAGQRHFPDKVLAALERNWAARH